MLLGTQWYILIQCHSRSHGDSLSDLVEEVATLFHFTTLQRWKTVILPGIFPFLITGLVTASGGARGTQASSRSTFHLKNQTLQTTGLGATISAATDSGQFQILRAGYDCDGDDGGYDQSVGVAPTLSIGGDALQAGISYGALGGAGLRKK